MLVYINLNRRKVDSVGKHKPSVVEDKAAKDLSSK